MRLDHLLSKELATLVLLAAWLVVLVSLTRHTRVWWGPLRAHGWYGGCFWVEHRLIMTRRDWLSVSTAHLVLLVGGVWCVGKAGGLVVAGC